MAVYLVGQVRIIDHDKWQQYVTGVAESLVPFDAQIVFRGKRLEVLAGEHDRDLSVVIRFADQQTLEGWFNSEAYQSLIELRDSAAEVTIITYEAEDEVSS